MIVNKFDEQVTDIMRNPESAEQDLQKYRALLEKLCGELKQTWQKKGFTDSLVTSLIDDCLHYVTRPLEDYDWDEMKADQIMALLSLADSTREFRNVVSWAAHSRETEIRVLYTKLETEKQLIFINDSLDHLDGVAYRLLTWLNARNSLIEAYRSR